MSAFRQMSLDKMKPLEFCEHPSNVHHLISFCELYIVKTDIITSFHPNFSSYKIGRKFLRTFFKCRYIALTITSKNIVTFET